MSTLLEIRNLHVSVEGNEILRGVDLSIAAGEVHSLMGPNGSGKSTLAQVLAGREAFEVTEGEVLFNGENLLDLDPDERACRGLFMAFQYPVEIPGVKITQFLKAAVNSIRAARGQEELEAPEVLEFLRNKAALVKLDPELLKRSVNEGFSGGEKKRAEIFQMAVLEPLLCILDETDSGLDIDALRIVAHGVNTMRRRDRAFLVITHYQRLLNHIVPDFVHVLVDGRIVKSGDKSLALHLEEQGYAWAGAREFAAGATHPSGSQDWRR
jgi:Fe-S cluster assembly ATP-binding protein